MYLTYRKILSNSQYGIYSLMLYSADASMVFCVLCFLLCMFLLYARQSSMGYVTFTFFHMRIACWRVCIGRRKGGRRQWWVWYWTAMTRMWSLRCRHRTKIRPSRSASAFCAPHRSAKWSPSKPGCTWSVQPHFTVAVARSSRVKIQQHANQKQPNKSWNSGISSQLLLAFATKNIT